jgi:arginyl-tRNA synthetase
MKQHIQALIDEVLKDWQARQMIPSLPAFIQLETTKNKAHGDFASNIALVLAKILQKNPRDIASQIVAALPASPHVEKIEIAGAGFINFFLSHSALTSVLPAILKEKEDFGRSTMGREKKVLVEFLSANPTGPLHVGHGRHAAFGAVISNLLALVGFKVYREYYVNDAGRQMDILATSIWLRYLELCDETIPFPANAYRGDYVINIAASIFDSRAEHFKCAAKDIFAGLPPDEPQGGDKEVYIDSVVARAKQLLGDDKYSAIFDLGVENVLADIREDLTEFGIHYDNWFSEKCFIASGVVDDLLKTLKNSGHTYEKEGAVWFRSTDFHDEKDRVLVRQNGQRTYFANDVAYHLNKFERGFDIVIDVFGADHHGYVPRMKAAMQASGIDPERLIHLLVQFVTLYRNGQQVQMSTRSGSFVTLRELREEVGNDAARFFYVMRKCEQHVDFDLDLAKSQSNENPIYYVQYAYARICSVVKQLKERQLPFNQEQGLSHLHMLTTEQERQLLNTLSHYQDVIVSAALEYAPHQLTHYLRDLAADFHAYYNAQQFLVEDADLRNARIVLILATQHILLNGFNLLGISARESM